MLALRGDLANSVQHHAFGPVVAAGLVWWSVRATQQRQLLRPLLFNGLSRLLTRALLAATGIGLISYWLLRLRLESFPST